MLLQVVDYKFQMMVVKVGLRWVVDSTDIDDRDRRVSEVVVGRVSPEHWDPVPGYEYADGQKVVFMGAAWVRDNGFNHAASQHAGRIQAGLRCSLACRLSSFPKTLLLATMAWRTWQIDIDISKAQANLQRRVV